MSSADRSFSAAAGSVFEFSLHSASGADHRTHVDVAFTRDDDGCAWQVPCFWAGEGVFRVRFAPPRDGSYRFRSACSDDTDTGLHAISGRLNAIAGSGGSAQGRLRVAASGRTLATESGDPFFWMGDTWWMGLSPRLPWPLGFKELTQDRVSKGFSVIQIVLGPLPEFEPTDEGIWHPQQANEAGWPWEKDWARINPAFYDLADLRIAHLVERGLVPCIVGMWGAYLPVMGLDRVKEHWRNLIARYAAYPVVFCIAGEINHTFPPAQEQGRAALREEQRRGWTEIGHFIRALDPFDNPITAHPGLGDVRPVLTDDTAIDVNMMQTSHWTYVPPAEDAMQGVFDQLGMDEPIPMSLEGTVAATRNAVARVPAQPVVNGEPAYEGIMGSNWADVQRFLFWTSVLAGCAGHTYGAQGIWQMTSRTEITQTRGQWGSGCWEDAMHYSGGEQVARGRRLFERFRWWDFAPIEQPWVRNNDRKWTYGAGIEGQVAIYYLPSMFVAVGMRSLSEGTLDVGSGDLVASFHDPRTGRDVAIGPVQPDDYGQWKIPPQPSMEDWVLVLETDGARVPKAGAAA